MRKTKIVVLFILGFVIGALAAVGVYFLTVGEIAWQEYVETKLIPNIVLAFSAISALCVAALPIINKIQASISKFNQATKDVNDTVENSKRTDRSLAEQDAKIEAFTTKLEDTARMFIESVSLVKTAAQNTEQIVRIGFGNTEELVKKGYAAEIAKVGVENESNKET